jgi:thiosulfate/3-mercaptopyruvate sulfurtransferase
MAASSSRACSIVDVRSPDEYLGRAISPPGLQEGAQRGGHVPGAVNVPWARSVNPDGTFKSADQLRQIYVEAARVDPARPAICYCRVGERSSHTWFVLKYLLGIADVRNYDGSWTEYGNLVGVPIER